MGFNAQDYDDYDDSPTVERFPWAMNTAIRLWFLWGRIIFIPFLFEMLLVFNGLFDRRPVLLPIDLVAAFILGLAQLYLGTKLKEYAQLIADLKLQNPLKPILLSLALIVIGLGYGAYLAFVTEAMARGIQYLLVGGIYIFPTILAAQGQPAYTDYLRRNR